MTARKYRMIGGSRHGEMVSILYGRRLMAPKPNSKPDSHLAEFEYYHVKYVPALGAEVLVLDGLDDGEVEALVAGTGFEPAYPSL